MSLLRTLDFALLYIGQWTVAESVRRILLFDPFRQSSGLPRAAVGRSRYSLALGSYGSH